mgnify:FL=1|jgi:hypothetical protein
MMSIIAVLIAGCGIEGGHGSDCDWAVPIRPSPSDQLTNGTARQILTHNETGAALCGWMP